MLSIQKDPQHNTKFNKLLNGDNININIYIYIFSFHILRI